MTDKQQTTSKPKASSSFAQHELDKAEKQFEKFDAEVKTLTLDRLNETPKQEAEPQTKLSSREVQKIQGIWLKPKRSMGPGVDPKTGKREVFNEAFRSEYEFKKEPVLFTAENKEVIGESIDLWTKPFPGVDCEEWNVPVNKPVWGPRYLAERIKGCFYHKMTMEDRTVSHDSVGSYSGSMVVDSTVQRLDAHPVSEKKSVFMGASGF